MALAYSGSILGMSGAYQPGIDSHYHYTMAQRIADGDFAPDMSLDLPWTIYRDLPVDHYWGLHLLLAPLTRVADKNLGMKLAAALMFALVPAALFIFLRFRRIPYAWAWALLPIMFSSLDWRYLMLRGGQLMLVLILAFIAVAFYVPRARTRRALIILVAYIAMLSYHGAILLLPIHVVGLLALRRQRGELLEPIATVLGIALGLTINPYMDTSFSTWRFAFYHIGHMGSDSAHVYPELSEFHGFPLGTFVIHPEWTVLLFGFLGAVAWVAKRKSGADSMLLAGISILLAILSAKTFRLIEYSVPLVIAFLATFTPRQGEPKRTALLAVLTIGLAMHGLATWRLVTGGVACAPSDQYRGAASVLAANGGRPVLNIAEADYNLLLWEYPNVSCVQGLSRYFLLPYRDLYSDVSALRDRVGAESPAILARFAAKGVRLVAVRTSHPFASFADTNPELLDRVFSSGGATIYEIVAQPRH